MPQTRFQVLYSDIGGVLGTNGWDTGVRDAVCRQFKLDGEEIAARHRLMFDSYERGYTTFHEYLQRVFFASSRDFRLADVRDFAYAQSIAWPENIEFLHRVKESNKLKIGLISNEGDGITEHRVGKFRLREVADFMVISHFVHMRKPDKRMWKLALDLAQVQPHEAIYIDDRAMFVDIAGEMGFAAFQHISLGSTAEQLRKLGVQAPL